MSNNPDQRTKGKHEKNAERLQQSIAGKAAQIILAQKAANEQKSSDPKSLEVIKSPLLNANGTPSQPVIPNQPVIPTETKPPNNKDKIPSKKDPPVNMLKLIESQCSNAEPLVYTLFPTGDLWDYVNYLHETRHSSLWGKRVLRLWRKKTPEEQRELLKISLVSDILKKSQDDILLESESEEEEEEEEPQKPSSSLTKPPAHSKKKSQNSKKRHIEAEDEWEESGPETKLTPVNPGTLFNLSPLLKDIRLNVMFNVKDHRHWMGRFRAMQQYKVDKGLFTSKSMLESPENFDPLPDLPLVYDTKEMSSEELDHMKGYKSYRSTRNMCPELKFTSPNYVPPTALVNNLTPEHHLLIGNRWRERFYPEDYMEADSSPLHKLLSFKIKQNKRQARASTPERANLVFSYEELVLMTARRLIKTGDPTFGRPNRLIFEDFKERFWYSSVYHKHKDASVEKLNCYKKAWFFFHVYETIESYKENQGRHLASTSRSNHRCLRI